VRQILVAYGNELARAEEEDATLDAIDTGDLDRDGDPIPWGRYHERSL
jgi:hypothetical protein